MAKALAHPLRAKVLARLNEGVASPNELSRELDEPLGNVSYHVKALLELGCIELVDTAQRRGAIEHYYRAIAKARIDDSAFKKLPASIRSELSAVVVQELLDDVTTAIKAGTFDQRSDRHASRSPLTLDEQGWGELQRAARELLDRAQSIGEQSEKRLKKSGDEPVQAVVGIFAFEGASKR